MAEAVDEDGQSELGGAETRRRRRCGGSEKRTIISIARRAGGAARSRSGWTRSRSRSCCCSRLIRRGVVTWRRHGPGSDAATATATATASCSLVVRHDRRCRRDRAAAEGLQDRSPPLQVQPDPLRR